MFAFFGIPSPAEGQGCARTETLSIAGQPAWYEITFPATYTAGTVGWVYFMNRYIAGTGCGSQYGPGSCQWRAFGSSLTLYAPAGNTQVLPATLNGDVIQSIPINPGTSAVFPDLASPFQTNETNRRTKVRFVRIKAAPVQCLHFREVMVIDTNYVK